MLGDVGNDSIGETIFSSMKNNNVNISRIEKVKEMSTGIVLKKTFKIL